MKHNIIQITAMASLRVPHSIPGSALVSLEIEEGALE